MTRDSPGEGTAADDISLADGTTAPIEVDPFTDVWRLDAECGTPGIQCTPGSFAGGVREAAIELPEGKCGPLTNAHTYEGSLCLKSAMVDADATVRVWWDGQCDGVLTPAGLGLDLAGAQLELTLARLDQAWVKSVELAVDVYSGEDSWSRFSTTNERFGLTAADESLTAPRTTTVQPEEFVSQTPGGADFANVTAVRLSITALVWGMDACVGPLRWVFDARPAG